MGSLEFDDENAVIEDAKLREQVESYNRRLREFEEQSKARSRHLAGLVTSTGHTQFPSHHHLQSDLLLEVSFVISLSAVKISLAQNNNIFIIKIFANIVMVQS